MSDLIVQKNFLVDKEKEYDKQRFEANKLWTKKMLQEKKSIVVRLKQDRDDLLNGKVLEIESNIIMYEAEVDYLEKQVAKLGNF